MTLKNWQERALKTFVQAFLGVLIPELIYFLNAAGESGGTGTDGFRGIALMVPPVLCSSLAAGLSAVWNLLSDTYGESGGKGGDGSGKDA